MSHGLLSCWSQVSPGDPGPVAQWTEHPPSKRGRARSNRAGAALVLALLAGLATGCTSKTALGPCVGLADQRDSKLVYRVDALNLIVAIIFVETVVIPVYVGLDDLFCPIGVAPPVAAPSGVRL